MKVNDIGNCGEKLFDGQRKDLHGRKDYPFGPYDRIHRVVSERPRFEGLDYSGLQRNAHSQVRFQSEEKTMIRAIIFALLVLAATVYLILEDHPRYCTPYFSFDSVEENCLTYPFGR